MQVQFKTDELKECICGFKPTYYTVGYGRTPYDVFCPNCKKQTAFSKCRVTGSSSNVIDYWNKHISKLTKEELQNEVTNLELERKQEDPDNEYKIYDYYWMEGKGETLYKKW